MPDPDPVPAPTPAGATTGPVPDDVHLLRVPDGVTSGGEEGVADEPEASALLPGRASKPSKSAGLSPASNAPVGIWNALLADPRGTCQQMSYERENLPARPLNVNITPDVAAGFDDQCRRLRVKKKDVVELLLRGWLEHVGTGATPPD